jgi:lysophospholipase L1-like esterase
MRTYKHGLQFLLLVMILNIQNVFSQDWADLGRYAEANKQLKQKATAEKRVVFMGNSITEFWSVTDSAYFKGKPYINRGISGQTTPQMLIRFRQDVIELNPDLVVILAGINDIAQNTGPTTIEAIFGNIVSMTELARSNNIQVVLSTVLPAKDFYWRPGLKPAEKITELNRLLNDYAQKNNIPCVDYYSAMVDKEKGLSVVLSDDGVHPNLAGYKLMEKLLEEKIKRIIPE